MDLKHSKPSSFTSIVLIGIINISGKGRMLDKETMQTMSDEAPVLLKTVNRNFVLW